ncbi:hypothetical protein BYT27DRAFT_7197825 [Phlegmacium glaucopus]|nr:hypothetical protein BYT27DRAFT_7197825 [Phlegmacium glaucopus]
MGVSELGVIPGYVDAAVGAETLTFWLCSGMYLCRRMNLLTHIVRLLYLPPYLCRLMMSALLLYHLQQTNSGMRTISEILHLQEHPRIAK